MNEDRNGVTNKLPLTALSFVHRLKLDDLQVSGATTKWREREKIKNCHSLCELVLSFYLTLSSLENVEHFVKWCCCEARRGWSLSTL